MPDGELCGSMLLPGCCPMCLLKLCRMQGLLRRNPEERLKAADALEHPWIRDDGMAPETPLSGSVVCPHS